MKKLALLASVAIITVGSVGTADAQYRRHRGGWDRGGAVAAGLIGGLALGAIASAAANPYYGPAYYRPAYYAPPRCVFERRRVVNPYGRVVVRRIRTCY